MIWRSMLLLLLMTWPASAGTVGQVLDIDTVWSGHPVGFDLLTSPPHQYVAYYDADRHMVVAQRKLDETTWTHTRLPQRIGWDSHNYITLSLDREGYLHLAGNMHVHPLRYFRSTKPYDSSTLERVKNMVGTEEERCTYPEFFTGPEGDLVFTYRDGSSGKGNQIYNRYDAKTQIWSRLLDQPLIDGEGKRNAYISGPTKAGCGMWHMVWVWRSTSDCATNHHPSYARSKDLVHWETGNGEPLELPITFETGDVVDPVPEGGGIINGNVKLGFDLERRPVVTYHKYDDEGNTQLYNTRLEDGDWVVRQASDWDYRWEFGAGGTIPFEVRLSGLGRQGGYLMQTWSHSQYGKQRWKLDPETLQPVERLELPKSGIPREVGQLHSDFPGMQVKMKHTRGVSGTRGVGYLMRWETLGQNRDRAREKPWPEASALQLYEIHYD